MVKGERVSRRKVRKANPKSAAITVLQKKALKGLIKEAGGYQDLNKVSAVLTAGMEPQYNQLGSTGFFTLSESGDDVDAKRNGDKITAKSLTIKGTLDSTYEGETLVRLMLVQYKIYDGASIDEVLKHASAPLSYNRKFDVINSMVKMNPSIKFNILADQTIKLSPKVVSDATGANNCVRRFRIHHNFTKSQSSMTYNVGGSSNQPYTNVCYLYACYGQTNANHYGPTIQYIARERFIK